MHIWSKLDTQCQVWTKSRLGTFFPWNNKLYMLIREYLSQVTGRKADAMLAAHLASEAALRLVKPGNETYEVTDTVSKIAQAFKCKVSIKSSCLLT